MLIFSIIINISQKTMSINPCLLSDEECASWEPFEEDCENPKQWKPLCVFLDGIRYHVLYRNEEQTS